MPMKAVPEVLLVDDNPADIDLTSEVLADSKRRSHVNAVTDGSEGATGKAARDEIQRRTQCFSLRAANARSHS